MYTTRRPFDLWVDLVHGVPSEVYDSQWPYRYISFEPWNGGFNNIRMSLEFAMALAIATGRTLVLPDEVTLYIASLP